MYLILLLLYVILFNLILLYFQKEETRVRTRYAQNVNSMLQCEYNSVYFVCRKPKRRIDHDTSHRNGSESNGMHEQEN